MEGRLVEIFQLYLVKFAKFQVFVLEKLKASIFSLIIIILAKGKI